MWWEQGNLKVKIVFDYIVNPRPAGATRDCGKKWKREIEKENESKNKE